MKKPNQTKTQTEIEKIEYDYQGEEYLEEGEMGNESIVQWQVENKLLVVSKL